MVFFFEEMWFRFSVRRHLAALVLLLPFSAIYCLVGIIKKIFSAPKDFGLPIVSIGNLTVGGSGKTPFVIELCKGFERPCVLLRGYGRDSKGLYVVSEFGEIKEGVQISGDEAALIAKKAANASVIVSEDRIKGIEEAKKLGCDVLILDDGFGKFGIKKVDILLFAAKKPSNPFCIPSGGYRFPRFFARYADICAIEGIHFQRVVVCPQKKRYALVTAISNPQRLDEYLGVNVEKKYYFADHYDFKMEDIWRIERENPKLAILCTQKDGVKLERLGVKFDEIGLEMEFSDDLIKKAAEALARKFNNTPQSQSVK